MKLSFLIRAQPEFLQSHKFKRLWEETLAAGYVPVLMDFADITFTAESQGLKVLYKGQDLPATDAAYWAFDWKDSEAWTLIRVVEAAGYPLFMAADVPLTDKVNQALILGGGGVRIPSTRAYTLRHLRAETPLAFPLVMKGRYGARGEQVCWVEGYAGIGESAQKLGIGMDEMFVLQEPVYPLGQDVRAFVIGNKVVAAMVRHGLEGDFRANYSLSGRAEATVLTEVEERMVLKAHALFKGPFSGVDFIRTENGPVVLEVNLWPGLEGIEKTTGLNIAAQMVAHMLAV
jgi:ribosomal protein S6--L-glutamate ligase